MSMRSAGFPRLISRGLIEAEEEIALLAEDKRFPRLISRGLIEARVLSLLFVDAIRISTTDQSWPH